eukprot:CAMPEP_0114612492 /NCGR_PEP_ID=MMETSP0168-20121206/4650_1 /TAXON_ID=95228 ORGANISM="Vannella sp., Strain DIVA3 517/6/12" /NCGR_SAMPLE_ID=MMETSP0168 /ASSEMBLY_ACC=CAM_ASM_000044 /LENGTH=125 /DNA_ID=CAMNT_0001823479 /DNA_START=49 /DNA_END=426 /DNA_ORIENTATION=+
MSQELTWQLIKKHNCFLIKRDGALFSSEPSNLMNKNSFKYSGLANNNTVGVEINSEAKGCVLVTKKKSAAARRRPAKSQNRVALRKDFRRVAKTIQAETQGKFYRRDLTSAALARWSKISQIKSA